MLKNISPMQRASLDLESIIRENIDRQTGGRMRRLDVSLVGNRVIVAGETTSYYIKQLALASVLKTVNAWGSYQIVHDIGVKTAPKSLVGIMDV